MGKIDTTPDNTTTALNHQLEKVIDERDITPSTIAHIACYISGSPYTKTRALDVGSCGRVGFGRKRGRLTGIVVFVPTSSFTATVSAERAADQGIDGDNHDQPWSDKPIGKHDDLGILSDPSDAAAEMLDVFTSHWTDNNYDNALILRWSVTPFLAILGHAATRASLPDVEIWHGELTETGRAGIGREREGEHGLAIFIPQSELWQAHDPERIIEAINEPWW